MAESMEGVVAEGEQPKTENVEQKTVAGKLAALTLQHGYLFVPLYLLHHVMVASPHVSKLHDCYKSRIQQVSVSGPC
jgi:hypothetical protein